MPAIITPGRTAKGLRPSGPFSVNRARAAQLGITLWPELLPNNGAPNTHLVDRMRGITLASSTPANVTTSASLLGGVAFNGRTIGGTGGLEFTTAATNGDLGATGASLALWVYPYSTMRGTLRLIRSQSSTVGMRKPAACAMAGTCRTRLVEPPTAACATMAL